MSGGLSLVCREVSTDAFRFLDRGLELFAWVVIELLNNMNIPNIMLEITYCHTCTQKIPIKGYSRVIVCINCCDSLHCINPVYCIVHVFASQYSVFIHVRSDIYQEPSTNVFFNVLWASTVTVVFMLVYKVFSSCGLYDETQADEINRQTTHWFLRVFILLLDIADITGYSY